MTGHSEKHQVTVFCTTCDGSGTIFTASEYPDLPNQQWCSCESGRAKAAWVEQIVRRSLAERRPMAA